MRLLLFPLLLASLNSYAQLDVGNGGADPCTEADIPAAGGTLECTSLLLTGAAITINNVTSPLIIKVTGSVSISGFVDLRGRAGTNRTANTFSQVFGGEGGFGAGDGGGEDGFGDLFPGLSDASTSTIDSSPGRGEEAVGDPACGSGGGGAGFRTVGFAGASCGSGSIGAAGGTVTADSIFNGTLRGGVGGGAGGDSTGSVFGAGGGGGSAIQIIAGGDINIQAGATLSAKGGNGGDGAPDGGGGGAGSGGVVWLQSLGNINIAGSIDVTGGIGVDTGTGGIGGNGGDGFIRLDDLDGVITGGGTFPGAITNALGSGASSALKSDISCGTVKPSEERDTMFLQLIMAFIAVEIFARIVRKYSFKRYRVPFGKTEV